MLFTPKHDLNGVEARLRAARETTPALMSDMMVACERFEVVGRAPQAKVMRLIESSAWTDAALALLQLELPHWKVRRLVQEDGEWHCRLSREPQLPLGLDEAIEVTHEVLPLVILIALLQARRARSPADSTVVPRVGQSTGYAVCCENFF